MGGQDSTRSQAPLGHLGLNSLWQRASSQGVDLLNRDPNTLTMFHLPHRKELAEVDLVCLGIPMDIGAPFDRAGARMGPESVRRWSWRYTLNDASDLVPFEICSGIDWGDIDFQYSGFSLDRNLQEIADLFRVFKQAGVTVFAVGGEHTVTYGILKGLTRGGDEPVGLVQIDAHGDTEGPRPGHRIHDGSLISAAVADGFVDPERTIQIGLRSRSVGLDRFAADTGMRTVRAREVKRDGVEVIVAEAREKVGDGPIYVSFDTDVIDASEMPGTTVPEPFGLSGWEARELLLGLRGLDIVGADIVELAPVYDPTGKSSCLAAGLSFEIVCLLAEAHVARSGNTRQTAW
jgi:agmatinase